MKVKLIGATQNPIDLMWTAARTCYSEKSPIEIWEEETQDFGLLPEGQVCVENFKTAFGSQTSRLELMGNMWLYIKTPEGNFPMMLGKVRYQDEKTGSVTITYYK
mgnify:CR=1 FL=1